MYETLVAGNRKRPCSRMLCRRLLVSRLGSRGPGGDQKSLRLCSQSVRKRSSVAECRAPVVVAKRSCISKVPTVTGIGGSWSRNAELSSLLDLRLVVAYQECLQSQGSRGGPGREAQNCRWSSSWSSRGERRQRNEERRAEGRERGEEGGERRGERGERGEESGERRASHKHSDTLGRPVTSHAETAITAAPCQNQQQPQQQQCQARSRSPTQHPRPT